MKKLEYGRSMVEMLGVLAIIGVLSVGAIAGYQKAMMKHRLNKQAQQLSQLLNVLYRHKASWGTNPPPMNLISYLKKLGEIPKEMIKDKKDNIYDVFQSEITIATNGCDSNMCNEIMLTYEINNNNVFDVCQNVYNIARGHSSDLHTIGISKRMSEKGESTFDWFRGDKYCQPGGFTCIRDITKNIIYDICKLCEEASSCDFYIYIR